MKSTLLLTLAAALTLAACNNKAPQTSGEGTTTGAVAQPASAGSSAPAKAGGPAAGAGLLVGMAQFIKTDTGTQPGPARLEIITHEGGAWKVERLEDKDSDVFHKAIAYTAADGTPGILTVAGTKAMVKFWTKKDGAWTAQTIWEKAWGGKRNRMRDVEVGDLFGDGSAALAIATHDQGAIATLHPKKDGTWEVKEIDQKADTFVHEIEIGDVDGDGKKEFYSTPSEPNRLEADAQQGLVMRYDPITGDKKVVADLGLRHAKEIWVGDVDGDGKDELYVAVEAKTKKEGDATIIEEPVELRRYVNGTDPKGGDVIAKLDDRFCRFLTVGDVDGDGKKEMVAAPFKSGLWLLRPGADPTKEWAKTSIDSDSSGFEHAAILLDLDGDKKDELYVGSDNQKELRAYRWNGSAFDKEVLLKRGDDERFLTWNITALPAGHLK